MYTPVSPAPLLRYARAHWTTMTMMAPMYNTLLLLSGAPHALTTPLLWNWKPGDAMRCDVCVVMRCCVWKLGRCEREWTCMSVCCCVCLCCKPITCIRKLSVRHILSTQQLGASIWRVGAFTRSKVTPTLSSRFYRMLFPRVREVITHIAVGCVCFVYGRETWCWCPCYWHIVSP